MFYSDDQQGSAQATEAAVDLGPGEEELLCGMTMEDFAAFDSEEPVATEPHVLSPDNPASASVPAAEQEPEEEEEEEEDVVIDIQTASDYAHKLSRFALVFMPQLADTFQSAESDIKDFYLKRKSAAKQSTIKDFFRKE